MKRREPYCTVGGNVNQYSHCGEQCGGSLKTKNNVTIWPCNPAPGHMKNMVRKDTCTLMIIAALFTIAKSWEQPKCPLTEEWIEEMWYVYTMEYYSAIKKNEIMSFVATWLDLESVILNEVRQRRRNVIWHPLYLESKKKWYKQIYKIETYRLRKQIYGWWGEGIVRDYGKVMYTLLYLKWIINKDLMYGTWNSAQCYMAAWMGEGLGENGYMYIYG